MLAALLVLCSLVISGSGTATLAQDATPATATAATCVAPDVPPGTPEDMSAMGGMDMDMATPADSAATPEQEAPAPPSGTAVDDQATIDAVTAATNNISACLSEGNALGALALTTSNFVMTQFGTDNIYTAASFLEGYVPGPITKVNGVFQYDDGSVGIDYNSAEGMQVLHALDVYVQQDGAWLLDASYELPAQSDLDTSSITVTLGTADNEFAMVVEPASFAASPATNFVIYNNGTIEHEFIVLQVPEGFDPATLTNPQSPADLPADVTFVGATFAAPGQVTAALFEGLQPGNYVGYCFIPAEDGATHAEHGMYMAFTITEPVVIDVPDVVGSPAS
jgi:hypothetical protein